MPFSSSQWTIPELCVWIVTKSRDAINGLTPGVRDSLKSADFLHPGAYAARDLIVEAAQRDSITVTCAGKKNFHGAASPRRILTPEFWTNAEIEDRGHWQAPGSYWCIAKRIDQPVGAEEFRDLLVDSAQAKELWPADDKPSAATNSSGVIAGIDSGSTGSKRSGNQTAKATQAEHDEWMKARVEKLLEAGTQSNVIEDEIAARAEPPEGLGARNDRNMVRIARKAHAPRSWQKTDVRRQE